MPFDGEDTWRVLLALKLPQSRASEIQTRLDFTQSRSEHLVRRVKQLLQDIEESCETRKTLATEEAGLIKLDVIEYSEHRTCEVKGYQAELRQDLANLIGLKNYQTMGLPF